MSLFAVKWYEYAHQSDQWRALWHALAAYLPIEGQLELYAGETEILWQDGSYDLTWACGGDVALNPDRFQPLAVPVLKTDLSIPDEKYCSLIVQRKETLAVSKSNLRIGLNYATSYSGHLAFAKWWHELGLPRPSHVQITGGHEDSVLDLIGGKIDTAAIDSKAWRFLRQAYPAMEQSFEVVAQTQVQPAPPLCLPAIKAQNAHALKAWQEGFEAADAALKEEKIPEARSLGLIGFHPVGAETYAPLRESILAQLDQARVLTDLP